MNQLALLHALGAACTLRRELEEETVCPLRLSEGTKRLMVEAEALLHDPECVVPLVLVRQRIGTFLQEAALAKGEKRPFACTETAVALLNVARNTLLRLIVRVWTLQEVERKRTDARSHTMTFP